MNHSTVDDLWEIKVPHSAKYSSAGRIISNGGARNKSNYGMNREKVSPRKNLDFEAGEYKFKICRYTIYNRSDMRQH